MMNLDYLAGVYAPRILDNITDASERDNKESLVNQALGILAEQGPFAMMLWAKTKRGKGRIGDALWGQLTELMTQIGFPEIPRFQLDVFNTQICSDFIRLTTVRQLFERVLIYARYYAKVAA
jgi:hypothetical protein